MTRREVYQRVAELADRTTGPRPLLAACISAMRSLRDLPAQRDPLARELLRDREFVQILQQEDALGQIYQALNAPALESAYRMARRERRKFSGAEIPATTQLFTPRWLVEFLIQSTLGMLWREMHPDSRLGLPWLAGEPRQRPARRAIDLRVLDPACGTMNFGIVAIEMLEAMYREEQDRAGGPGWPAQPSVASIDQIPRAILRHNLAGIDIDPIALELASATLRMKFRPSLRGDRPQLHCADALFDPRIEHRFAGSCDAVVTNPPYLSARNLPKESVNRMKRAFPAAWRDTCACFIERCIQFSRDGGRAGVLAMQSFMFTGSFQKLREKLRDTAAIETIAHFGAGVFDIGNPGTLQTAGVVLRREPQAETRAAQTVVAFRLIHETDKRAGLASRRRMHRIRQQEMLASPRAAWSYWLDPATRRVFSTFPSLAEVAPPRQGLATTDNARFVRFWWEVQPTSPRAPAAPTRQKWFPYAKSGRFRRWYEAPRHRVDWEHDGSAIKHSIVERYPYLEGKWKWVAKNSSFYGRGGITWSYLTSGRFSARRLEEGAIFDVAGSSLFPEDLLTMLGVLNSSTGHVLLEAINPTVNFQVGDLAQLPVPREGTGKLRTMVAAAIELHRRLDTFDETTTDFAAPIPWTDTETIWIDIHSQLASLQTKIDRHVAGLYSLHPPDSSGEAVLPRLDRQDLAARWVSFALSQFLLDRAFVQIRPMDPQVIRTLTERLSTECGGEGANQIAALVGGIERFLERRFFPWHVAAYQRRPILWQFQNGERACLIPHEQAHRSAMIRVFRELRTSLPDRWDRFVDDGIAQSLAPLRGWIAEASMKRFLDQVGSDQEEGRYAWSRTWRRMRVGAGERVNPAPIREFASVPPRPLPVKACSRGARSAYTSTPRRSCSTAAEAAGSA